MNSTKRDSGKIASYVLIAVVIIGLLFLVYWIVTENPARRFRGIEKIRGGSLLPAGQQSVNEQFVLLPVSRLLKTSYPISQVV